MVLSESEAERERSSAFFFEQATSSIRERDNAIRRIIELAFYAKRTFDGIVMICWPDMRMRIYVTVFFMAVSSALSSPPKDVKKQFLNVDGKKPPGYTHVVTSAPGKMIFISGRGGAAKDGTMPQDFATQATNTFEDLKKCLALAGATFKDVVKINYFVKDLSSTTELRKIRAQYLNMDAPPAATLVQAGLGDGVLLEVEAVAIIPE
jgi:enamine deaminase RidA (YjgF/YER057c/UK114 family)